MFKDSEYSFWKNNLEILVWISILRLKLIVSQLKYKLFSSYYVYKGVRKTLSTLLGLAAPIGHELLAIRTHSLTD